jgi:uncharacterized protein (TIGR02996 family)
MSTPPAHRRLVPRRPRPSEPPEDLDVTQKRVVLDRPTLDLRDPDLRDPDPRDSMSEVTLDREPPDPEDALRELLDELPEQLPPEQLPPEQLPPELPPEQLPDELPPGASFSDLLPTSLQGASSAEGIEDRPTAHLSPAEYGLLAAITEGHEPSRLRYADWLERRGESSRAELLRLDHALHAMRADDPRFIPTLQRIREVAARVSVDWRSRVSRAAIEGCSAYGVTCPMYWRALPAEADDVRTCPACHDRVYYCVTLQLAQERVQHGQCVALDATCQRWPHDLDRQCDGCGGRMPPQTRFCPHCGRALPRAASLG